MQEWLDDFDDFEVKPAILAEEEWWDEYERTIIEEENALYAMEWDQLDSLRSMTDLDPEDMLPSMDNMLTSSMAFKAGLGTEEVV